MVAVLFSFLGRHGLLVFWNHVSVRQLVLRHLQTATKSQITAWGSPGMVSRCKVYLVHIQDMPAICKHGYAVSWTSA